MNAKKACRGSRSIAPLIFNVGDNGADQIEAPSALPLGGKKRRTHCVGAWVDPTAGVAGFGEEKISYTCRHSNPGPSSPYLIAA